MHTLNIIFSETDTFIGKFIRYVLKCKYNHVSIALDNNFDNIYSFSRRFKYIWLSGCFCREDKHNFKSYEIVNLQINDEQYCNIKSYLKYLSDGIRLYNYIGAVSLVLNKAITFKSSYICSTFCAYILWSNGFTLNKFYGLYTPEDLYKELVTV